MSLNLTAEQILALAPDASSAKAGKGQATPKKWPVLGSNEQALWGECQGSGAKPYQVRIDLTELGFHCTCPSRKFPCKHALGLLLLLHDHPDIFIEHTPPDWVAEWLANRSKRAQQRTEKETKAPDPKAQAKRASERYARTAAGLQELETWLRDLVRQGLATVQGQPTRFWETPATRLVDAQAPGVARLFRQIAALPMSGEGWAEQVLAHIGRVYLLIEGFKRMDELPEEVQADIRSVLGWTQSQDELLAGTGLLDDWLVLGQRLEEEDKLRTRSTWLWGRTSQRAALVLDFAFGNQPLEAGPVPGSSINAELVFYPGAYPLRALVKARHTAPTPLDAMPGHPNILTAITAYTDALARFPWLERLLLPLEAVVPVRQGTGWAVRDKHDMLLPLAPQFSQPWLLLALSGGHPLALAGEWNGSYLLPLSAWAEGRFHRWSL